MARYIDADELLKRLEDKRLIFEEGTPVEEVVAEQISALAEAIEEAPAADVVEVVRCKDCKYTMELNIVEKQIYPKATKMCMLALANKPVQDNDFCQYGERKESNDYD